MTHVTVVIPTWNGRDLLRTIILPSLAEQTYSAFQILVVDNGSTDDTAEYLRAEWRNVRLLQLDVNEGFAGAVNKGIAAATTPYVALVNNDVELARTWLAELVEALDRFREAASVVGKLMDYGERDIIGAVGDVVTAIGTFHPRAYGERDIGQYDVPERVFSACAGAALYRRAALADVGPFDEDFFAYVEDVDWGFRAQLLGYDCWFVPSAVAYHVGGVTAKSNSVRRKAWIARNSFWFVVKNYPATLLLRNGHKISYVVAQRFWELRREGDTRVAANAAVTALKRLPTMFRRRRTIFARRRRSDASLSEMLEPGVFRSIKLARITRRYESVKERGGGRRR